ncbi:hypothetical protein SynPROSU1_00666 [Synechococcus sp. PROS-U-1]|nr:hypothetical protein SynPROSU1_00666 [Synechococcus sp. PROS-U-1]
MEAPGDGDYLAYSSVHRRFFLWLVQRQSSTLLKALESKTPVRAGVQGFEMITLFSDLSSMS